MIKIILAAAVAALIVYDITTAPGLAGITQASEPQRSLKGDRLSPRPAVPVCSQTGWPHYDSDCIRNPAPASDQPLLVRQVRIVSIDRLPAKPELADHCDCHR